MLKMVWLYPGTDPAGTGFRPAPVQGWLPEWMSPTCSTRRTLGSELTESISRCAELSRMSLYGQSPNTASVSVSSECRSKGASSRAMAGSGARAAARSVAVATSFFMVFFLLVGGNPIEVTECPKRNVTQPTLQLDDEGVVYRAVSKMIDFA